MLRKLVFVGMILVLMASFTVVLADQDGRDRWCNSDQYGCWVTGDDGEQIYIMFWSEYARELFMGPGSNAVVTDPFPAGKMPLDPYPESSQRIIRPLTDAEKELIAKYAELVFTNANQNKYDSQEELESAMLSFYTENPAALASDYNEDLTYYNRKNEVKDMDVDQKISLLTDLYWNEVEYYQKNFNSRDEVFNVVKESFDLYENSTDENKLFSDGNSYLDSNLAHFDITSYTNTNTNTNTETNDTGTEVTSNNDDIYQKYAQQYRYFSVRSDTGELVFGSNSAEEAAEYYNSVESYDMNGNRLHYYVDENGNLQSEIVQ